MRIAICDDEVSMVQILEEKIKKLLPDAVIDKYLSGDELIASGSKPDILFLDIQMPGMDGMETAKMLRQDNEDMILIFVTAAEEYVFQAFDVGAFHYLVKPFFDEKLKEVVTKAVHNIKRSSRLEKDEKYIMVQTAGSHIKIFLRDIVYAEVYNRKVIIHTRSTDIEYYGKLQELSDMAGTDFFRTHRAYLVHFKYVEKYDAREELFITTKIWISNAGYEKAKASIEESLKKLKTDYVDLLLIHQPFGDYYGTYRAMEEAYKAGKARAIGVSNFYPDRYIDIAHFAEVVPAVNQVETHVFQQQKVAREYLAKHNTQIMSWGPFAE